jgi:Uma2 family endonuclease
MFTIYNEDENRYQMVEEPDPSLTYNYSDYLKWKFEERVELIKGRIFKMSPAPNLRHQEISTRLVGRLFQFLEGQRCRVFAAPFDVRLPVKNRKDDTEVTTVVQPDVCIICDASKLDEKGCIGAPDLVIEILSPGNSQKEIRIKHELYAESGVKEYSVVYPAEESIAVFLLTENGTYAGANIFASGDQIRSKAVPGLVIDVKDVFSKQ